MAGFRVMKWLAPSTGMTVGDLRMIVKEIDKAGVADDWKVLGGGESRQIVAVRINEKTRVLSFDYVRDARVGLDI